MSLKHKTLPAGVDQPGFGGITPTLYAEEHSFSGGAQGAVLVRNTTTSDGKAWVSSAAGLFASTGANEIPTFTDTIPTAAQDNITRVGTVVSGVWNAGAVTSSGNIAGVNGSFSGTLGVTGAVTLSAGLAGVSATFSTTLAVTGAATFASSVTIATGGYLQLAERTTTPSGPATGAEVNFYKKSDKLILQYTHNSTVYYAYMVLEGDSGTWLVTSVAP